MKILGKLAEPLYTLFGLVFFAAILAAPWFVYEGGELSLKISGILLVGSLLATALLGLLGIFRVLRSFVAVGLYGSALGLSLSLWLWSVLIVGSTWGIATLYIVNFFFGIGAVFAAGFILLTRFAWWNLLGFICMAVGVLVITIIAQAFANASGPAARNEHETGAIF